MELNTEKIGRLVRELLIEIGEDPAREGLLDTPKRVAKAFEFLTSGYRTDTKELINGACFTQETSSMVIVKDIEVYSMCEHHMLPFFGRCHIGYIPSGTVFGVSKLARLVDMYARRLQLQERLSRSLKIYSDASLSLQPQHLADAPGVVGHLDAVFNHDIDGVVDDVVDGFQAVADAGVIGRCILCLQRFAQGAHLVTQGLKVTRTGLDAGQVLFQRRNQFGHFIEVNAA